MAFSVSLHLDVRSQNKDGSYKVILQIIVNRKNTSIATDYSVPESDWDSKNRRIRNSSKIADNIARINNILSKQRSEAMDKLTTLHDSGQLYKLPLKEVRLLLMSKSSPNYVLAFTNQIITDLKAINKIGNAMVYQSTLQSLKSFTKGKDFPFSQLTVDWLQKYEAFYFSKETNSTNGFGVYARTLRSVYNKAILKGYAKQNDYPFKHFKIEKKKTKKRALKEEPLTKLKSAVTEDGLRKTRSKDYFLASFYLAGISFVDLAHLKLQNIKDGRIKYDRQKSGQTLDFKIVPQLQEILDKYIQGKSASDYIFPIIKRTAPEDIYKDIKNSLKVYNKTLKKIAEGSDIKENITSYWSRHSWATMAKRKGVSTAVISEGLGHENESTTKIYLDSFENDVLDAANALVTG